MLFGLIVQHVLELERLPFGGGWAMRRVLLGVTVAAILAAGVRTSAGEPVRWKKGDGGNNHYYDVIYVGEFISWEAARIDAEARGGYLATITSSEENDFIVPLLRDLAFWRWIRSNPNHYAGPWIGGYQEQGSAEPDGGWSWITDEPFEFTDWLEGEPNNFYGGSHNEDSMNFFYLSDELLEDEILYFTPEWNDSYHDGDWSKVVAYVIEWDKNPKRYKQKGPRP